MNKPTMFSKKSIKPKKVFIIKNLETSEVFECPLTPKHYLIKESAEYTKEFMQLDEYVVLETELVEGEYV